MKFIDKILYVLTNGRGFKDEQEKSKLSLLVLTSFLTSLLIWLYALNAYLYGSDITLFYLGVASAVLHILSVVGYYYFSSIQKSLNLFIFSGFISISAWTYYTGGFGTYIPIWYAVLPLIGGVVGGKKDLLFWGIVSVLCCFGIYILYILGLHFPETVSETGMTTGKVLIMFGLIFLNSVFMYAYIADREKFYKEIVDKSDQIECLLSLVGHDISNPLTVVNLSTKQLKNLLVAHDDEKIQKCLQRLESNTNGINSILKQIRDFQSVRQSKVELEFEKVYLNDIVEYVAKVFETSLQAKNLTIKYDWELNNHIHFMGNLTVLKYQIFGNLISNAIKFSDAGSDITITAKDYGTEGVLVQIMDQGIGISENNVKLLFENRTIPSSLGTEGEKGSGLGMSIVKRFVEMSHGSIAVNSKTKAMHPDCHGTQFSLNFKKNLLS